MRSLEKIISETKLSGNAQLHIVMRSSMETISTVSISTLSHKKIILLILFINHMMRRILQDSVEVIQMVENGTAET